MSDQIYAKIVTAASRKREWQLSELASEIGIPESTLASHLERLREEGLISYDVREEKRYALTERGREYQRRGLPEVRLALACSQTPNLTPDEARKILGEDAGAAISWALKKSYVSMTREGDKRVLKLLRVPQQTVDELIRENPAEALQRGIALEKTDRVFVFKGVAENVGGEKVISRLTHEDIISERWKTEKLKPYDVTIFPPPSRGGRKNFFEDFLDWVRDILEDMGFEEARGPYLEAEFWNFDALFQAQDHPARELHDVFSIPYSTELENETLIKRVAAEHEAGWQYVWDPAKAASLILRSQNTAVSARFLSQHNRGPLKMYSVDRVFRKDELDQKHHVEFYQSEGIVVDKNLTLRDLLGFLTEFARQLGFDEVRFYPSYFPFTEPSVEGYVKHPRLGWIETLPGGVFRPEVTRPLGVSEPVLAWGIGISRLAMIKFDIDDIRQLYEPDLELLMRKEVF